MASLPLVDYDLRILETISPTTQIGSKIDSPTYAFPYVLRETDCSFPGFLLHKSESNVWRITIESMVGK